MCNVYVMLTNGQQKSGGGGGGGGGILLSMCMHVFRILSILEMCIFKNTHFRKLKCLVWKLKNLTLTWPFWATVIMGKCKYISVLIT